MELQNDTPLVDERRSQLQRIMGPLALSLIFCASATGVLVYLSSDLSARTAETASAESTSTPDPFAGILLQGQGAYVLDLTNGHVLYSLNPDTQLPLASMTKVATVLAVSEVLSADSLIRIPYDTAPAGSAERLQAGTTWRLQDVINFTLIASSNDGADILAAAAEDDIRAKYPQAPAGSATLWRMNDIARQLGLTNTYFLNDNGLDISTTQAGAFGSARDIARLFAFAATSSADTFAGTTQNNMRLKSVDGAKTTAFNTDLALSAIPGIIMGKTGYTDLAGGNLGIVFDVGPAHPVVAVVLHSTEDGRFDDMRKIVAASIAAISAGR